MKARIEASLIQIAIPEIHATFNHGMAERINTSLDDRDHAYSTSQIIVVPVSVLGPLDIISMCDNLKARMLKAAGHV